MDKPSKPRRLKKPHTITMEPKVWSALEELAEAEERSVSYILNRLAKEHLKSRGMLKEKEPET